MSAHSAIKNRDNAFTAETIPIGLTNLFGIELDSFQTYQPPSSANNAVHFDDGRTPSVQVFAEVLHPTTARVIGRWQQDYLKDLPAATEQQLGKGKAIYYGSLFNLDAGRYLIKRFAGEIGLKPLLAELPEQVEVTRRTKGGADFFFLLNHGDSSTSVNVGEGFGDVITGEPATASLTLAPFGYRVLKRERLTEQVRSGGFTRQPPK
jgi:beta-galactosidase